MIRLYNDYIKEKYTTTTLNPLAESLTRQMIAKFLASFYTQNKITIIENRKELMSDNGIMMKIVLNFTNLRC